MTFEVVCSTEADTRGLGRRLASLLGSGDVILLSGGLGVGKTVFAGGVGEGLGVEEPIVSPTFVLVRRYQGLVPVVHADLYRIGSTAEIDDLELVPDSADGVLIVEWGDAAEQSFPDDHLLVRLDVEEDGSRSILLVPRGSWTARPLAEVMA